MIEKFRQRLSKGDVVIIDGGMGPELARRGVPMFPAAWAAPAVLDHFDTVRGAHEDYIRAGADVIIANTFMANHTALALDGLGERVEEINRRSIDAALEAREAVADRDVLIAGALFPGAISPPDAEKVDPNTMMPEPDPDLKLVAAQVREQAGFLADAGADLLALEMIPTATWGKLTVSALADVGLPLWLCPAYGHHKWDDGSEFVLPLEPLGQAGEQVRQILTAEPKAEIMAVNVMHTEIEEVDETLDDIEPYWSGVLGAYPHRGTHPSEPPYFRPAPIAPSDFSAAAQGWVQRGVQIIGGCCGIGPEHIRALKDELPAQIPENGRRPKL